MEPQLYALALRLTNTVKIMEYSKDHDGTCDVVYMTVNEKGETQNVFATLGMAIDDVYLQSKRISEELHRKLTRTKFSWRGRDGIDYSLEVKVCPVCKNVNMDYMARPRSCTL